MSKFRWIFPLKGVSALQLSNVLSKSFRFYFPGSRINTQQCCFIWHTHLAKTLSKSLYLHTRFISTWKKNRLPLEIRKWIQQIAAKFAGALFKRAEVHGLADVRGVAFLFKRFSPHKSWVATLFSTWNYHNYHVFMQHCHHLISKFYNQKDICFTLTLISVIIHHVPIHTKTHFTTIHSDKDVKQQKNQVLFKGRILHIKVIDRTR